MRTVARLCAAIPFVVAACAPKAETPVADSAATAAAPVVDAAAVRQTVEQANTKLADALQRGDTVAMATFYDNDAAVMMSGMPAWRGAPEIRAAGAGMFQAVKFENVKFTPSSVDVTENYAIETGAYEMTTTEKGAKPVADKGKYVTIWKKQADGSWKIYRDISNTDIAPKR